MRFADLHALPEDDRIREIGWSVMNARGPVAFIVEDDGAKADRYIAKLKERFPRVRVMGTWPGPTPGVVTVKVQRRTSLS